MASPVHVFGIRHHGPGSARSLLRALEELQPDALLVEGPPDADSMLPLLTHEEMRPPVALLVYARDEPKRAGYYPFAEFSPEWQALRFGLTYGVPTRFMDLPQFHSLALAKELEKEREAANADCESGDETDPPKAESQTPNAEETDLLPDFHHDPLLWLAQAAGYSDGERWWDHMVEHRQDGLGLFEAILEAMTALR